MLHDNGQQTVGSEAQLVKTRHRRTATPCSAR